MHLQEDEFRYGRQEQGIKPGEVLEKLLQVQDEMERKSNKKSAFAKKASDFIYNIAGFGEQISSLVRVLLPESPEYTVTLGMFLLLFKAVVTQKDREEALTRLIESISQRLPVASFYETVFPTNAMKACVARIYARVMKILDEALVYFRGWRLSKSLRLLSPAWTPSSNMMQTSSSMPSFTTSPSFRTLSTI